jgi:hypothetical protein
LLLKEPEKIQPMLQSQEEGGKKEHRIRRVLLKSDV